MITMVGQSIELEPVQELPNGVKWKVQLAIMGLVSFFSVLTALALLLYRLIDYEIMPMEFSATRYVPIESEICPGEYLEWRVGVSVNEAPTVFRLIDTVFSITENTVVVPGTEELFMVFTETTTMEYWHRRRVEDLPPGEYEIRRGVWSEGYSYAAFVVPFSIGDNCP